MAGAALVGTAVDGGQPSDGEARSRTDGTDRGALLTFHGPDGPTASAQPEPVVSAAPRRGDAISRPNTTDSRGPADSRPAATRSATGRDRATRGAERSAVARTQNQRGGTPSIRISVPLLPLPPLPSRSLSAPTVP